jgi:hypothetical protein
MLHLPSAENNRQSHFVAFFDELTHMADLRIEVMDADLRADADLFDLAALLLFASFLQLLFPLVTEFGGVGELANRRVILRRDFYKVETAVLRELQCLFDGFDA